MKVVVISNCVTVTFVEALKAIAPNWDVRGVDGGMADGWFTSGEKPEFVEFLQECELYIGDAPERRKCGPALNPKADRIILPHLWFHGLHPDVSYVQGLRGPLSYNAPNTIASLITLGAWAHGLGVDATVSLFNEATYAEFGFFERYGLERTKFLETFSANGIDLSADFAAWEARGDFFFVPVHPRKFVAIDTLRRALLGRRYLTPAAHAASAALPESQPDYLEALGTWPVYPELAARRGFTGSLEWVRPGKPPAVLGLEAFVSASLEALGTDRAKWQDSPQIDRAAATVSKLRPGLAAAAQTPAPDAAQAAPQPVQVQIAPAAPAQPPPVQPAPAAMAAPAPAPAQEPAQTAADGLPGQWLAAFLAWDAVRGQLPDQPATYTGIISTLRQNGAAGAAERLLGEAVRRFHDNPELAIDYARTAEQRSDWAAALARWQAAYAAFPRLPMAYLRAASLLRKELARPAEGEALLEEAAARLPNVADIWTEYAAAAAERKDRPAAIERYTAMTERFPGLLPPFRALVALLREERRFDEADTLATDALIRFPDDRFLQQERALTAHARPDYEESALRWSALRVAYPDLRMAYRLGASALINLPARYDEAEELLTIGLERFPDHFDMAMDFVRLLEKRGKLAEAVSLLERMVELNPGNAKFAEQLGRMRNTVQLRHIDGTGETDGASGGAPQGTAEIAELDDRALAMQFESMGNNCEFGMVQRRLGAEPLGLLRWVGILPDPLARALHGGFDGWGDLETTQVKLDERTGEWYVLDSAHGSTMHTFIKEDAFADDPDRLKRTMANRIVFLRRKFLEDLSLGHKIFLYKFSNPITAAQIEAIRAGVAKYGNNTFLLVRPADAAHPPGSVEQADGNLLIGYMDSFVVQDGNWDGLSMATWLAVLRRAHALWQATRSEPRAA